MRSFARVRSSFALGLLALSGIACSKTNNVDQSTKTTYEQIIGPDGGWVGDQQGLSVFIPAGALGEDTEVTLSNATAGSYPPALPQGGIGEVYSFEPHGLTFATPATLHLPLADGEIRTAYRAQPGGDWEQVQGNVSLEGGTAWFESITFSFYVLSEGAGPVMAEPAPDAGSMSGQGGSTSTPPSGGTAGVGGTGQEPLPGQCTLTEPDMTAPTGTSDASGSLGNMQIPGGVAFTAVDGFAVLKKTFMDGGLTDTYTTRLDLVFTDYANACGYAMTSGTMATDYGLQPSGAGGKQNSVMATTNLTLTSMTMEMDFVPGTYDATSGDPALQTMGIELVGSGAMCERQQSPGLHPAGPDNTFVVTIDSISANSVTGSISATNTMSGDSLMGAFDFPFCELPSEPPVDGKAECCLP